MDAKVAARIFHDWSLAEGLLSDSAVVSASTPQELALIEPVTEVGKTTLRHKRVLSVGFNQAERKIYVYTKLAAPTGKKPLSFLPSAVDDVKVVYRQGAINNVGEVPLAPHGNPPFLIRVGAGDNRYTCGGSVSVGNCIDAGTLTALVKDAAGALFGLSNNHVTGSCSCAEVGLPIVIPGLADVAANSMHPMTIGTHRTALPLIPGSPTIVPYVNNSDAAIFAVTNPMALTSFQGNFYDTPTATKPLTAGLIVEKVGRTTGFTRGTVQTEIFGPFSVSYAAPRYAFTGTVYFTGVFTVEGFTDAFSSNGDSGSLVTTVDNAGNRFAVGIVFAGMNDNKAPGNTRSLILAIEPILASLQVTLVSGHNI